MNLRAYRARSTHRAQFAGCSALLALLSIGGAAIAQTQRSFAVAAGLLAHGSPLLPSLPNAFASVTVIGTSSPFTVAGAALGWSAVRLSPNSLLASEDDPKDHDDNI